jgi:hypothetical protein
MKLYDTKLSREVPLNVIASIQHFIQIYHSVQKLLGAMRGQTQTDRLEILQASYSFLRRLKCVQNSQEDKY